MYYPQEYRYGDIEPRIMPNMIYDAMRYNNENRIIKQRCRHCNADHVWLDILGYNVDDGTIMVQCPRCGHVYRTTTSGNSNIGTFNIQTDRYCG